MALSYQERKRIHSNRIATPGARYYGDDENVYIGTPDRRLRVLEKSYSVQYANPLTLNNTNVKNTLDELVKDDDVTKNKQIEIDFGTGRYQRSKTFTIQDANVTLDSIILLSKGVKQTSDGRKIDELWLESLDLSAKADNQFFHLYVRSLSGTISGKFIINYKI